MTEREALEVMEKRRRCFEDDCDEECRECKNKYSGEEFVEAKKVLTALKHNNQEAKADNGKPKVSLVPMQMVLDTARVREYGNEKYHDPDNWKTVEADRYIDALVRHALAFANDPYGLDEESGLPHLWHIECNCAFLSELMKGRYNTNGKETAGENKVV